HPPAEDLPERFLVQRNLVRRAFGTRWWEAVAGASARWVLDYVTLLTALSAVGQHPRPSLVLLAFCAAQLLAQIPVTPGGLGVVEAGLTGTLALIGVPAGAAAIATLAYRLINYWLALPIGGVAWLWHRRKVRAGAVAVPRPARAG
ncbi:MAG: YbhN family protein, partial [Solirubrobacteraceae bacterium]